MKTPPRTTRLPATPPPLSPAPPHPHPSPTRLFARVPQLMSTASPVARVAYYLSVFALSMGASYARKAGLLEGVSTLGMAAIVVALFLLAALFRGAMQPTPQQAQARERAAAQAAKTRAKPKRA